MTRAIAMTLLSHWMRHPVQLFTLLAGLALATGLWSAVQAINGEARASYARAASQLDIGGLPVVRGDDDTFPVSTYVKLSRAGWNLSAVLEGTLDIAGRRMSVRGVDLLTYPPLPAVAAHYEASGFAPVDALTAPGLVFAHPDTAARLPEAADFPGIVSSPDLPRDLILTDIGVAELLLGLPGRVSYAVVLPDQPLGRPPLHEIASELHQSAPESRIDAAPLTDSFHLNLTAFGLLSFAVGLFIVHGTVGLAFAQRRGAIRTLRALGASLKFLT
ncbi:MAG: ABC transporter permease, partial [Pseudomonadota bacterium]